MFLMYTEKYTVYITKVDMYLQKKLYIGLLGWERVVPRVDMQLWQACVACLAWTCNWVKRVYMLGLDVELEGGSSCVLKNKAQA